MVLGSVIFYLLEASSDQDSVDDQYRIYIRERELLRRRIDEIFLDRAARRRDTRLRYIDDAVNNESQWSLMSAMYYSGTLFTTIGYGDIACTTTAGRILTVIYSCVGIPLMLITLNDCGKFLYRNINGCVKSLETFGTSLGVFRICSRREHKLDQLDMLERAEAPPDVSSLASEIGSLPSIRDIEDEEDEKVPRMSVKVALGITIGWIFFCSALFRLWEDWTYGESCYFMYISLSTIGLGDINVARRDMMVLCFVFVIIGLSLVSMSINVVQVALEDFYVNLMMKLIIEYQEKMAAAMDKVAQEAQEKGLEIPTILNELDEKSGMPKILQMQNSEEGAPPPIELEQLVQKQILLEEANETAVIIVHEVECQTEVLETSDKREQTVETVLENKGCQAEELKNQSLEVETQTEINEGHDAEAQTSVVEVSDAEVLTVMSHLLEAICQTETMPVMDQICQTAQIDQVDVEVATELETKNVRVQTPCPVIEQRTIQTEDLEERKSPSKMSSARKRLRRAFAKSKPTRSSVGDMPTMSEWKDVEEEAENQDEEDVSEESLHWDPVMVQNHRKLDPIRTYSRSFSKTSS
ncbi:unnamed protein product [Nippostrongylus brasiliensis]|uniref:Ion_trans_2 domain-containing protein n=1 Tax=Nippostrongylus brasiliensis TaxID=27835 RepID=A0A0N4Y9G1_NIPBR|nr:unnamed protein product [Nippostrongylus brasiliensis]